MVVSDSSQNNSLVGDLTRVHESGMLHETEDGVAGARAMTRMEDARQESMEAAQEALPLIEIGEV